MGNTSVKQFGVFADWNEDPTSRGTYSPLWLAHTTMAEIYVPPKGKHGRIDFVLSNMMVKDLARVLGEGDLDRIQGGGSDHGLILGRFMVLGQWYRFVLWNVERDRTRAQREQMVDYLNKVASKYNIHFMFLQECGGYHDTLRRKVSGFKLIASGKPGQWHNVIMVRNDLMKDVSRVGFPRVSRTGWITADGKEHAPLHSTALTFKRQVRLICSHNVPSVDVRNGRLVGPPKRMEVFKQFMQKHARMGQKYNG